MAFMSSNTMCDCLCRSRMSNKGLIAGLILAWVFSGSFILLTWSRLPVQHTDLRFVFRSFNPQAVVPVQPESKKTSLRLAVRSTEKVKTTTPPEVKTPKVEQPLCVILMWVLESDVQSWWPKENTTLTGNCRITYKPQAASTANITVINQGIMNYILPWKPQRHRWQYFVWWSEENPWNLKHFGKRDPSLFPGFFNLTMTHRRDSDIFFPTWSKSSLFQEMEHATESVDELLRRKYYLALWEAKDCSPSRGNQVRMKFAVALVKAGLKYLKIGACFNNYSKVDIRRYMFYVVMVDGYHCRDYLNGQIWHALVNGLVPVVFGPYPDDVRSQLPYHSYIHAEEFSSPKELVGYINMVSRNKTLYREYFTWRESLDLDLDDALIRTHYPDTELRTREATGWSRLCERYRELVAARETRVISSLSDYVFNTESRECMGPLT